VTSQQATYWDSDARRVNPPLQASRLLRQIVPQPPAILRPFNVPKGC